MEKQNLNTQSTSPEGRIISAPRLLIAASGTGGHLFPALALAEQLPEYHIEWLGVADRLEKQLVPSQYRLNTIALEGFQQGFGLGTLRIAVLFASSIFTCRSLLKQGKFNGVFTTGGYIAAPAIVAARSLGLPAILHESNALPGKVTRTLSPLCDNVALGFASAAKYLKRAKTIYTGTPVRSQFRTPQKLSDLEIPSGVPLIVAIGGSQGAVALNKLIRECAGAWFDAGAWIVHQTGVKDPEVESLQHPQYIRVPFYDNMAGLMQRADLAIGRAGAGSLTELAITGTPTILIPYPYAAEDHQYFNAAVFEEAGAASIFRQSELTAEILSDKVLGLLRSPEQLQKMSDAAISLGVEDSADRLAKLVRSVIM